MKGVITAALWCLVALYPILVFFGLKELSLPWLGGALLGLAALRLWLLRHSTEAQLLPTLLALTLILLIAYALLSGDAQSLRYYPLAVNATLFVFFATSLVVGTPAIERIARLQEPDLPEAAIAYTRKVTWVWLLFFAANGMAAYYTARYCTLEYWTLYNGGLAYVLMGLLFSGEWLIRRQVRRGIDAQA